MARPERNSVDYFPHPVSHGRKMFYIRGKFNNDGYVVWFMLLEQLGKAEYHYLDLADQVQLMYLSSEFMVSEEALIEIIGVLVKLGEFEPELWEQKILFSVKFIDSISDAYKKRNNNCIDKNSLLTLLTSKQRLKGSIGDPNKEKGKSQGAEKSQTKVNDTIIKESIEDFGIEVEEIFISIINQWLKYKNERHEEYKKQGLRTFVKQLTKYSNNDPLEAQKIIDKYNTTLI